MILCGDTAGHLFLGGTRARPRQESPFHVSLVAGQLANALITTPPLDRAASTCMSPAGVWRYVQPPPNFRPTQ